MIGVSPDSPEELSGFRATYNLPFVLLSDPNHRVAELYGTWKEKKMYGKTYFGISRSHYVIDEAGNIAGVQIGVSPADSVESATASVLAS